MHYTSLSKSNNTSPVIKANLIKTTVDATTMKSSDESSSENIGTGSKLGLRRRLPAPEEVESLIDVGDRLLQRNEQVSLLIEIVGATNLVHPSRISQNGSSSLFLPSTIFKSAKKLVTSTSKANQSTTKVNQGENSNSNPQEESQMTEERICNPYVVVTHNGEIIHTTTTLFQDNNPIWDVKTHSLFLFNIKPRDFINSKEPLIFTLCHDATTFGKVKIVGRTTIKASTLFSICNAQRTEFELEHPDAEKAKKAKKMRAFARKNPTMRRGSSQSRRGDKRSRRALDKGSSFVQRDKETSAYSILSQSYSVNEYSRGKLALRVRIANHRDKNFIETIHRNYMKLKPVPNEAILPSERDEAEGMSEHVVNSVIFNLRRVGKVFHTANDGIPRVKVKPGPDPSRPSRQTEFLSKEELLKECMAPSTNWVVTGTDSSGHPYSALNIESTPSAIGRLYVEVLSCQDLPNLDVGGAVGNFTDPFVSAVFEDTIVQTNVIDDELSPLWMPWSQRAFVFNMKHPLSTLYLGVFDYDAVGEHDGIGRVAVNLQNLYPQTNYTLRYNLHQSSNVDDRTSYGTIVVRLRVEIFDPKAFALAARTIPPRFHINVRKERSLSVARYTCYGAFEDDKFDLAVLRSYINELFEYKALLGYGISDGISSLLFWRPQVQFCGFQIPLHSFCVFCAAANVAENPHLIPAFFFFSAAWIMIASKNDRRQHPSPWRRCKPFTYYFNLLFGKETSSDKCNILQNEGAERARKKEDAWKHRRKTDAERQTREWELQEELTTIINENIQTKTEGKSMDPFAAFLPILLRVQKKLSGICQWCRRTNSILRWEEGLISFWITVYCIAIGAFLLVIPVGFVAQWLFRIAVWIFLGPWMRAVDIFILKGGLHEDLTEEQLTRKREKTLNALATQFNEQSKVARLQGEENKKLKSMMEVRFGDYTIRVPERNVARHFDYPLSESMACFDPDAEPDIDIFVPRVKVRAGQLLKGHMIPVLNAEYDGFVSEINGPEAKVQIKGLHSAALAREDSENSIVQQALLGVCPANPARRSESNSPVARGRKTLTASSALQSATKSLSDRHLSSSSGSPRSNTNFRRNSSDSTYSTIEKDDLFSKEMIVTAVSTVAEGDDEDYTSFDERDSGGSRIGYARGSDGSRDQNTYSLSEEGYNEMDQGVEVVNRTNTMDDLDTRDEALGGEDNTTNDSYSPTYRASDFVDLLFLRK